MRCCLLALMTLPVVVAACGAGCSAEQAPIVTPDKPTAVETPDDEDAGPTAPPTAAPQTGVGATEPTSTPEPTELALPVGAEALVDRAREDLAHRLDLPPDAIRLESVGAVEWPDASLGCAQPGMAYAQVVTPGFRIVLEARGQAYAYHTDEIRATLCAEEQDLNREMSLAFPESGKLPIFVHVVQTYLLSGATLETPLDRVPPNTVFAFDSVSQTLLLRRSIVLFPETQVLIGQTTVIQSPGRSDVMGELFQVPVSNPRLVKVITVDGETDALTLAVGDQVFELLPGQSRSFKSTRDKAADVVTVVTHTGRPASIAPFSPPSGAR